MIDDAAAICAIYNSYVQDTGQFVEIGRKLDRWVDVGYWELILPAP